MAAGDAVPVPRKGVAYRAYFEIQNTAGALISGATGLDSEVDLDGAGYADCTNEATEIGASGTYFLDLTAAEMNADHVMVIVNTTSVNAIIPVLNIYPESLGDYRVNVGQWFGTDIPGVDTAGYPVVTVKDGAGAGEINTLGGAVFVDATQLAAAVAAVIAGILTTPGQTIDTTVLGEVTVDPAQLTALVTSIATAILITPANKLLTDAAGRVELQADGIDQIVVETGVNARQCLSALGAALAGVLAGVGTGSITFEAIGNPGTVRITCVNDLLGNRNTVVLNLPV
jgi:hypothetical protein